MFLYTEKYTESESDIQNNNPLYKIYKKHQNALEKTEMFRKNKSNLFKNNSIIYFVIYI